MSLRLLLVQAREPGDPSREDEVQCVASSTGVHREQIYTLDLSQRVPDYSEVRQNDGLILAGSGAHYVSKKSLERHDAYLELLRVVLDRGFPTLAICFGAQALAAAAGSPVVHAPEREEYGTYRCVLKDGANEDPLFAEMPERFEVQQGHRDHIESLPAHWTHLAASRLSSIQAFRVPTKPIWGFQFHPELRMIDNRKRFERYQGMYHDGSIESPRWEESPHASALMRKFVDVVIG